MPHRKAKSGYASEDGSIAILLLLLIPAILLIGGIATDICLINAQKKYVQSQADLASQSAVLSLPNLTLARQNAQAVVSANASFGDVTLTRSDVVFGSYSAGQFVPAADQDQPAGVSAVKVIVPSPYTPLLLRPVMSGSFEVTRDAIATRRDVIAFSLKNSLLDLDTGSSILSPLLNGVLGLNLSATALSPSGVLGLGVDVVKLLGLVSLNVAGSVLDYDDILGLSVGTPVVVNALTALGVLPAGTTSTASGKIALGSLIQVSPSLTNVEIGQLLPNIELNVGDLLGALVSVNGSTGSGLLNIAVPLSLGGLANVALSISAIQSAVYVAGLIDDLPTAHIGQLGLSLDTTLLSVITLHLGLEGGSATATATSLNCMANKSSDVLATFDTNTSVLSLALNLKVLGILNGNTDNSNGTTSLFGTDKTVNVMYGQLPITTDIGGSSAEVSGILGFVSGVVENLTNNWTSGGTSCGILGLGCVLQVVQQALLAPLQNTLAALTDGLLSTLLSALGIRLAPAELTLLDYSCSASLVQ